MLIFGLHSPVVMHIENVEMRATIGEQVNPWGFPDYIAHEFDFSIGKTWVEIEKHTWIAHYVNEMLRIFNAISS